MNVVVLTAFNPKEGFSATLRTDERINKIVAMLKMDVIHNYTQEMSFINNKSYFDRDQIYRVYEEVKALGIIDAIVVNDTLSPIQYRNLLDLFDMPIYDFNDIILEIASLHATSKESSLKVEIAKLEYQRERIFDWEYHYPSVSDDEEESKKITDANLQEYDNLINQKRKELAALLEKQQKAPRPSTDDYHIPVVAIIGYPYAGKTTLFNTLISKSSKSKGNKKSSGKKFTKKLQTMKEQIDLKDYPTFICMDTIGFIVQITPGYIYDAYRSVYMEIKDVDLLVNVTDVNNHLEGYLSSLYLIIDRLNDIPTINIYNKCENLHNWPFIPDENSLFVSLFSGEDLDSIIKLIFTKLSKNWKAFKMLLPYDQNLYGLKKEAYLTSIKAMDDGYLIEGYLIPIFWKKWQEFMLNDDDKGL